MKDDEGFSLLQRLVGGKGRAKAAAGGAATGRLSGAELEQAYRDLLLENQVLAESNQHLSDRLMQRQRGFEDSPAARELIRAQRNALAERSRLMRELEYQNKQLKREHNRLIEENRRLASSLARHMDDLQPLLRKEEAARRDLARARAELREKTNELARLTDRLYQLEARMKPQPPTSSAANSNF